MSLVSWETARATATRVAPPGPKVARPETLSLVHDLRGAAARAVDPVAHTARMAAGQDVPVLIVDRPGWIAANTASMQAMLAPSLDRLDASHEVSPAARAISGRVTGAEAGMMLAWLATKVLGQLDLAPQSAPRLLLVAPNILAVERELKVDPHDFRQWVALHEETHRVQLTGVPWLRHHLLDATAELTRQMLPEPEQLPDRFAALVAGLGRVARGEISVAEAVAGPEQRQQLARITAWMSLLEGHADVVMDEAGPSVVPSVAQIRQRFEARRGGRSQLDRLLRRLLGMEAKLAQYRDGARFVRGVMAQVGVDGFNAVWATPEHLPAPEEIHAPRAWVSRVHG